MLIRACVFLLFGLLISIPGCNSKSEVTQQSASPQSSPSSQQSTPAPTGTGNTQGEQPQQQNLNAVTGEVSAKGDACALITKAEIEAVQGEPVKETKSSDRSSSSFAISQCFYSLPTFNKSVSLEVTRGQSGIKEFWNKTFHKKEEAGEEGEEDRGRGEEGEKEAKPKPVPGVGDEAFWMASRVAGALYVLKNNAFIRISIGGPDNESVKIEKSKTLAKKALSRL
jgi:hypothetical protein